MPMVDLNPLRRILELEAKRGYQDRAVIGGLDRLLSNWIPKLEASLTSRESLATLRRLKLDKPSYASLPLPQRKQRIESILEFLSGVDNPTHQTAKAAPAPVRKHYVKPGPRPAITAASLESPITVIKGISDALAAKFGKMGLKTVRDLLYFFPNRHLDYSRLKSISELTEGKEETVLANVWQAREVRLGGRRSTEAIVGDNTGNVRAVWFNNPYMVKQLNTGRQVVLSGRVEFFKGQPVFESPEWEIVEEQELIHTGRLVPLYPLTSGLHARQVRKLMKGAVDEWAPLLADFMPPPIKQRCGLLDLPEAVLQAHFPDDETSKDRARYRLAFDELFLLQLGVLGKKRRWQEEQPGTPLKNDEVSRAFIKSLPFELTAAQKRVNIEISRDLAKSKPMSRLLQGEVGSGKTVIALAALLTAVASGCQGALMAPTEILAEQHFQSTHRLLARAAGNESEAEGVFSYSGLLPRPITLALLTGNIKGNKKTGLQKEIGDGKIDIVIGTHALIQKEVSFKRLGLAVVDEQHRFGVLQRSSLRQKGFNPHVLVMTATPIPRTLALTLYGDLDLSVIDELPPGRQEIKTKWLRAEEADKAFAFLRREVAQGRQAFIICPLIEESEAIQARAAVAEFERLSREVFPDLRLGLLHGRMAAADKDDIMRRFRSGKLDILVSTPVVEVGIDVPNATVMLIESADRFGLSQLHQFRGRVGRGEHQSYCILLADEPTQEARERLDVIQNVRDGFKLAEEDLRLRGPGEFFGTRQSGIPDLRMARISDVALLELARKEAVAIFETDPALQTPQNQKLLEELKRVWPAEDSEWS